MRKILNGVHRFETSGCTRNSSSELGSSSLAQKFSQLSIFSELNNLTQISMYDEFSGLCGITQEELNTVLRPCVEEYAQNLNITTDEAYALLKKNYDGYHLSRNGKDLYAPFSVLRAFDGRNIDHWRVADADGNITDEQVFGL